MKQILLISPYFPPSGDVGAKRALNLVRYLRSFGWEPLVLASPCRDLNRNTELEQMLPENLYVSRKFGPSGRKSTLHEIKGTNTTNSLLKKLDEKGSNCTPFDQYLWYVPAALAEGRRIVKHHNIHAIIVNADPWSGFIVAYYLARYADIPWIADLRDPWSIHKFKMSLKPAITRYLIETFESAFFKSAAKVILNTEFCCQAYRDKYRTTMESTRFTFIRNAFDMSAYKPSESFPDTGKFSMHYFGSFRIYLDPDPLFNLIRQFITKHGLTPEDMELVLYGIQRYRDIELVKKLGLTGYIRYQDKVNQQDTLLHLKSASVLLLVEGPNRRLQLPAKLYDYLAAKRPILALSDNPELNNIIDKTASGVTADFFDPENCMQKLEYLYFNRGKEYQYNAMVIREYSVDAQVKKFSTILDEVTVQRQILKKSHLS